jgi:hypothetical protein
MHHDSSSRPLVVPTCAEIDGLLMQALAQVRVADISEIKQEYAENGNNLEMDSQEAVTVIANVEEVLKCTLPGPEQLKPGQPSSIRALCELIERHLDSSGTVDTKILEKHSSAI